MKKYATLAKLAKVCVVSRTSTYRDMLLVQTFNSALFLRVNKLHPSTIDSLTHSTFKIIWVKCISLSLRSKTRRRATPLLPT